MKQVAAVLGAGGFIGRHLCDRLAGAGWHVLAATRQPACFGHLSIENMVSRYEDAAHFADLVARSNVIIHAAASTTPGSTATQPQIEGNLRTTLALLEAMQRSPDVRLLYFSSGGTVYGERNEVAAREVDALLPRSYHGAGKVAAEVFVQTWARQFDGTAIVLRPSNIYGPGQTARRGFGIVPTAFECATNGRPFAIWGTGETVRDYLFIDDLMDLCMLAVARPLAPGAHVFNAAAGTGISINALIDRIDDVTGKPLVRDYQPSRVVDIARVALDATAADREFGWRPSYSIDEGLRQAWKWFSSRQ